MTLDLHQKVKTREGCARGSGRENINIKKYINKISQIKNAMLPLKGQADKLTGSVRLLSFSRNCTTQ